MMNVTLRQLRAFDRIVRLGSFHAAARELGLSQPSISQRIRELEDVLGTAVFIRRGPRVSLTAEGHALMEYASRLLGTAEEMTERFRTRAFIRMSMNFTGIGATNSRSIRRYGCQHARLLNCSLRASSIACIPARVLLAVGCFSIKRETSLAAGAT